MMNHCLMNPVSLSRDELLRLSGKHQGIVFLSLGDESVPHFILDLVLELEREKVVSTVSPCEIFERSCLMENASGHRRDLALLLKSVEADAFERLKRWVSSEASHAVTLLSDYIAEYRIDLEDA